MPQTSSDSQSRVRKSMFGGTSRTLLSSAGKRGAQLPGEKVGVPGRPPITVSVDLLFDVMANYCVILLRSLIFGISLI